MTKVNTQMLKSLASEGDVADIISFYMEFFDSSNSSDSVPLQDQLPTVGIKFGEPVDGTDPGVEFESALTPEVLGYNLGFVNRSPLLFNTYRHRGGLSA